MPAKKTATIKPTHKAIQLYLDALKSYAQHGVKHEGAVETAFQQLLASTAKLNHCALIPKQKLAGGKNLIPSSPSASRRSIRSSAAPPSMRCSCSICSPNGSFARSSTIRSSCIAT